MTNGHVIVGSSTYVSQERETITFCFQQGLPQDLLDIESYVPYFALLEYDVWTKV